MDVKLDPGQIFICCCCEHQQTDYCDVYISCVSTVYLKGAGESSVQICWCSLLQKLILPFSFFSSRLIKHLPVTDTQVTSFIWGFKHKNRRVIADDLFHLSLTISLSCSFQCNVWWTRFCRINKDSSDLFPPVNPPRVSDPPCSFLHPFCWFLSFSPSPAVTRLYFWCSPAHRRPDTFPLLPGISGFRWLLAPWASSGPFFSQLVWHQDSHTLSDLPGFGFVRVTDCVGYLFDCCSAQFVWSQLCLLCTMIFIVSWHENIAEDANCRSFRQNTISLSGRLLVWWVCAWTGAVRRVSGSSCSCTHSVTDSFRLLRVSSHTEFDFKQLLFSWDLKFSSTNFI